MNTPLAPTTPYVVVDTHTGIIVYRTTYANRNRARRFADKRDIAYGAVRYICRVGGAS